MFLTKRRGFALIYLLLLSVVIAMILAALMTVSKGQIFRTRHGVDQTRALLAAESGLAAAMSELERNPSWNTGFSDELLPNGLGTYSATFSPAASATDQDCINNLSSDTPAPSYHGVDSVPPRSALLVVKGRSGTSEKTIEALVVTGSSLSDSLAMAASGSISMRGDVQIKGIRSLLDPTEVPVNVHTNDEGAGVKFSYAPNASGDSLLVKGSITSSSSSPTSAAIQLASPSVVDSTESRLAPKKLPQVNIEAMIGDHSGSPGPAIPSLPANMTFTGNNYYSGNVVINGDVVLDGNARLFVAGDLTINGSVTGEGALVVGGDTRLYGNADVTGDSSDYVSVLSRGSVVLSGFQGQQFMESLVAGDPTAAKNWDDTKWALAQIQNYIQSYSHLSPQALGNQMQSDDSLIDGWMTTIAQHTGTPPSGRSTNTSAYFRGRFAGATPLSSEAFLYERFQQLDDIFRVCGWDRNGLPPRYSNSALLDNYVDYDPTLDGGLFDSGESWGMIDTAHRAQVFQEIVQIVNRFDYQKLGSAEFKGYVFTSGALVVKNDLNLMGSVIVNGNSRLSPITVDGVTYDPGELALLDNSRLTYVQEIFEDGVQNLSGAGKLDIKRWVSR